ncbi:MAG: hypothetical protein M0P64_02675 [Candidatus Pacebacteria bacterium]|jgi:hypothetical protein|nr:hypothetical protein [Candidatus Paceibacterota bacterium]
MKNKTIQFAHGLMLIPFLTMGSPLAMFNTNLALKVSVQESVALENDLDLQAEKIDAYFAKRDMPLEGYGAKLAQAAKDNDLDWRLLPAIAIKESTGGKFACHSNPFGWGSCKIKFKSFDAAIETVAMNLGGKNPNTERYYKDKTTIEKLHHYNNSVVPTYTKEIFEFMELIEEGK